MSRRTGTPKSAQAVAKGKTSKAAKVTTKPTAKAASSTTRKTQSQAVQKAPSSTVAARAAEAEPAGMDNELQATLLSLDRQLKSVLTKVTALTSMPVSETRDGVRTVPLERATATFQRLIADIVEDQHAELLPPLIALREEMAQRAGEGQDGDDFFMRGMQTLDHVLALVEVQAFEPRIGEPFDSLIHLAVGESRNVELAEGVVAEVVRQGRRTARGKIVAPARVLVNRR